jgi:hypothetical protein
LEEGESYYQGRSVSSFVLLGMQKSAEAIVAGSNEPRIDIVEDSQANEGLNIEMFQI